jgi:hypothetical protein
MLDLAKHIVNQKTAHFESENFEDCTFCYVTMTPARPRAPPSARLAAAITLIERRMSLPALSQRLLRKPATRLHRLFPKLSLGLSTATKFDLFRRRVLVAACDDPDYGGSGSCSWPASSHGARIQMSHSSGVENRICRAARLCVPKTLSELMT